MIRIIKIAVQIISLCLIGYLIVDSFPLVDMAPTKNDHLNSFKKSEIDAMQNIDTVKIRAKQLLDVNRQIHKDISERTLHRFYILPIILLLQFILIFFPNNSSVKNNRTNLK